MQIIIDTLMIDYRIEKKKKQAVCMLFNMNAIKKIIKH